MTINNQKTQRLQKVIATTRIISRRKAEEFILDGRVKVNGSIVTTLGTKVDPERDKILLDDTPLPQAGRKIYLMMNKPAGIICSVQDDRGRETVCDLIQDKSLKVFPVGRLDYNSEGLLLLTNDGDWANQVLHPSHHLQRTYLARLKGSLTSESLARLIEGVPMDDRPAKALSVEIIRELKSNSWVKIKIGEGRNRIVRRMFEAVGHRVGRLKRISFGPLELGDIPSGGYRELTSAELSSLQKAIEKGKSQSVINKTSTPIRQFKKN